MVKPLADPGLAFERDLPKMHKQIATMQSRTLSNEKAITSSIEAIAQSRDLLRRIPDDLKLFG
jgi:hypothetical protein